MGVLSLKKNVKRGFGGVRYPPLSKTFYGVFVSISINFLFFLSARVFGPPPLTNRGH